MAGRIRDEDIALVRERTAIADVISEHVTLKNAGGGNLKGLCPFHDEKTPSFTVAPGRNVFFCHGCGKGGDAISFLMDVDHMSFVESVERLAARAGIQLRYVETGPGPGGPTRSAQHGQKQRLVAAHLAAAEFYAGQLATPGARLAREFLAQRGFGRDAAQQFGCGFAPDAWDHLTKHLRQKGFTGPELVTAGLSRESRSGSLIDRFRRRLLWPIRELSGDVIGFGARKLFDDDDGPKYLNTPETPIYKKSHVLYGIEHAKREIARQGRAVIVEGYTDVMACHLADVKTAVATCGTAFGGDHIGVLRRLLMDTDAFAGEIIFTFDGDAAGQKAALRAFEDDQRFVGRTFIAVSPDNMDPCDLRLAKGDLAVRDLVARREPLVDFALRQVLMRYDLDTVDGRVEAMRRAAPLVAKLKDREKRPEYIRKLAGDLGMEIEPVQRAVLAAAGRTGGSTGFPSSVRPAEPEADTPQARVEREALKLALQVPVLAGPMFDAIGVDAYAHPVHAVVRSAVADAGGAASATGGVVWIERVRDSCDDLAGKALVGELAVEPLRLDGDPDPRYVGVTLARVQWGAVTNRIRDLKSKVQRVNPVTNKDEYLSLAGELFSLEQHARALREQAVGELYAVSGFWDLVKRRTKLPADAGVTLEPAERVIAFARTPDGGYAVATNRGLRLPARADRLGWHEIHKAVWSGRELAVTPAEVVADRDGFLEVADRPVERVLLLEPGTVPEQVRSRVTGSVSYTAHHELPGGGVRVVARKVSGVDGLTWTARYDPGTPVTPTVLEETTALVAGIRSTADAQP